MSDIVDIKYTPFLDQNDDNGEVKIKTQKTAANDDGNAANKKTLQLSEISDVASRLGQVLAEETHLLSTMDVKGVAKLQDEKNKLIAALELQKKILKMKN